MAFFRRKRGLFLEVGGLLPSEERALPRGGWHSSRRKKVPYRRKNLPNPR
jgi:hypothetical protein